MEYVFHNHQIFCAALALTTKHHGSLVSKKRAHTRTYHNVIVRLDFVAAQNLSEHRVWGVPCQALRTRKIEAHCAGTHLHTRAHLSEVREVVLCGLQKRIILGSRHVLDNEAPVIRHIKSCACVPQ